MSFSDIRYLIKENQYPYAEEGDALKGILHVGAHHELASGALCSDDVDQLSVMKVFINVLQISAQRR